jgi:hypothetical protein
MTDLDHVLGQFRVSGTTPALVLGPSAGRGLWNRDALAEFQRELGGPGNESNLTKSVLWKAKSPAQREDLLGKAFALARTYRADDSLRLLAQVLTLPTRPRLYWLDPLEELTHGLRGCQDSGSRVLEKVQRIEVMTTKPTALGDKLRLVRTATSSFREVTVVDLGVLALPVGDPDGDMPRIRDQVKAEIQSHTPVLIWGWSDTPVQLDRLLADPFGGTLVVLLSPGQLKGDPLGARDGVFCLPDGQPGEGEDRFPDTVLRVLRRIVEAPPDGAGRHASPRGDGPGPSDRREVRLSPRRRGPVRKILGRIWPHLVDLLSEEIVSHVSEPGTVLGVVVEPASVRRAVAGTLKRQFPHARSFEIESAGELDKLISPLPVPEFTPRDTASMIIESAVALADEDVRAIAAPTTGSPHARPATIVLMPRLDAPWRSPGLRLLSLRPQLPQATLKAVNAVLDDPSQSALARRVAEWIGADPRSGPLQLRVDQLDQVLAESADDPDALYANLTALVGEYPEYRLEGQVPAEVRLRRRTIVRLQRRPRTPPDSAGRGGPPSEEEAGGRDDS